MTIIEIAPLILSFFGMRVLYLTAYSKSNSINRMLWADKSFTAQLQKAENSVQLVLTCRNAVLSRMEVELN